MRTVFFIITLSLFTSMVIGGFTSCSNELDQFEGEDKGTECRREVATFATRSAGGSGDDNKTYQKNISYIQEFNCCYLTTIMERWLALHNYSYFDDVYCRETAQQHYDYVKKQFKDEFPNWNSGDSIKNSVFWAFASQQTIPQGRGSQNLYSEEVPFGSCNLNDKNIRSKIAAIGLEYGNTKNGHVANVIDVKEITGNINNGKIYIKYSGYDFLEGKWEVKEKNIKEYTIWADGENGWYIRYFYMK